MLEENVLKVPEVYTLNFLVGLWCPALQTLTSCQIKICSFPMALFSDLGSKIHSYFQNWYVKSTPTSDFNTKKVKIHIHFQTKPARKPYPLGCHIPLIRLLQRSNLPPSCSQTKVRLSVTCFLTLRCNEPNVAYFTDCIRYSVVISLPFALHFSLIGLLTHCMTEWLIYFLLAIPEAFNKPTSQLYRSSWISKQQERFRAVELQYNEPYITKTSAIKNKRYSSA